MSQPRTSPRGGASNRVALGVVDLNEVVDLDEAIVELAGQGMAP